MSTKFGPTSIDPSEWISQAEAARLRGVSRQAIWKLVKRGRVRSIQIGGHTFINRADIESFEPRDPGRPKARVDDDGR